MAIVLGNSYYDVSPMEYVELGQSAENIPKIGFGTWQYRGGDGVLRRAVELGSGFVDTAEIYGTESRVAEDIEGIRDQVFLATKVSAANQHHDDVLLHAQASLDRLRTDVIDLYQLHRPNPEIPIEETMKAMGTLVREGKVRHVGVSNFSTDQMRAAQDALAPIPLASNQVRYSLFARDIEGDVLPYCRQNKITVIAYSPLSKGVIREGPVGDALVDVARELDKTPAQVMLNWVIAHEGVMAIPKTDHIARVDELVESIGWDLTLSQRGRLDIHSQIGE